MKTLWIRTKVLFKEVDVLDLNKEISKDLKAYMKHQNIDVAEFAEKCNLETKRVQGILDEESMIELEELAAISRAYNVSSEYFLGLIKYPFSIAKSNEEVMLYRKLSELSDDEVLEFIERIQGKEK